MRLAFGRFLVVIRKTSDTTSEGDVVRVCLSRDLAELEKRSLEQRRELAGYNVWVVEKSK